MRLRTADIDQEVKERAIACMGQILAHFGDTLSNELHVCLPIFLDRLHNEITRLTTVKALTCIAASPLRVDLKPIMVRRSFHITFARVSLSTSYRKCTNFVFSSSLPPGRSYPDSWIVFKKKSESFEIMFSTTFGYVGAQLQFCPTLRSFRHGKLI